VGAHQALDDDADEGCGAAPCGGPPCSVPVTENVFEIFTCTSLEDVRTWTRYEPSLSFMTRSTVPGYLAVAALEALVAAEPVTTVPMPGAPAGGRPVGACVPPAAWAELLVVVAVAEVLLLDEPQAARPPTARMPVVVRARRRRLIMGWSFRSGAVQGVSSGWAVPETRLRSGLGGGERDGGLVES
jgi:hypothetical protein